MKLAKMLLCPPLYVAAMAAGVLLGTITFNGIKAVAQSSDPVVDLGQPLPDDTPLDEATQEVSAKMIIRIAVFDTAEQTTGKMTWLEIKGYDTPERIGKCQNRAKEGTAENAEIEKEWAEAIASTDAVPHGAVMNFVCRTYTTITSQAKQDIQSDAVEVPATEP